MPGVFIQTNVDYSESTKEAVLRKFNKVMVEVAHKNEEAVMVTLQKVDGAMGNSNEPFGFIDVRSMNGIDHKTNNDVCAAMTKIMQEEFGIDPLRLYITFIHIPETCWGLMGGIAIWDSKSRVWVVNGEPCK
ncbi:MULTISPECIES: phenylpyruvate tautomerase MIF-related protein [Acutalibacteraceae]|uniref:phenylpyruvate tautomerase MIF-related protein n=1 Tax=Acutalibacteraceae TaxID=3082771 RepID=UPI0013E8E2AD|nr:MULTISPECIES: phenylpyruvate tautomerase MIF-related protein [Acutalibacteraceae]